MGSCINYLAKHLNLPEALSNSLIGGSFWHSWKPRHLNTNKKIEPSSSTLWMWKRKVMLGKIVSVWAELLNRDHLYHGTISDDLVVLFNSLTQGWHAMANSSIQSPPFDGCIPVVSFHVWFFLFMDSSKKNNDKILQYIHLVPHIGKN